MRNPHPWITTAVCAASLLLVPTAHAGLFDGLFGTSKAGDASQRTSWEIHDFSSVQLAPREAGTADNRHPALIAARTLEQLLSSVRTTVGKVSQPLMTPYEAEQVSEPLAQALASATPGQDVLLLSSERRVKNSIEPPMAVTARVFVNADGLQLVVRDARFDFYDKWRGTGITPSFGYGSRSTAGSAQLQSNLGTNPRADWLAFPLTAAMAPALVPAPVPTPARASVAAPLPVQRDAAFYDAQELRLQKLKSLREKDLITDQEYQQKRQEILKDM
ncbi:SHOCT domain-containing protein [Rhodoferax sp. WC2427]|uniref:SHOCT domain-containing protein n=1 Tax=Rhodoferax sp. WC2427 TaxID=3234144 RepID=UPI00346569E0